MNALTREQQLANIDLAERLWRERVNPEQVYPGLCMWTDGEDTGCGVVACFGGHLATWPEFREQGVKRVREIGAAVGRYAEAPAMSSNFWGDEVGAYLFGESYLFEPRGGHPADPGSEDDPSVTDHQLVLDRLAHAREQVLEQ